MRGIYSIVCDSNNRIYYGQTTNYRQRVNEHLSSLRRDKHENIHLQRAFNKYGEKSFTFEMVEESESDCLNSLEQEYIDSRPWRELFNINPIAAKPPTSKKGRFSEETLERMSKRMQGENNPNYGKTWTDERREAHIKRCKGKKLNLSEKERERRKLNFKGDNNPSKRPEVAAKISASRRKWTLDEARCIYEEWNSIEDYHGKLSTFSKNRGLCRKRIQLMMRTWEENMDSSKSIRG